MTDLSTKTALVTGASRGIGRATAARLARDGARVLVHYAASADKAEELVAEIKAAGGEAEAIGADLSTATGAHELAEKVRALGLPKLDILVANAGTAIFESLAEQTEGNFDHQFALNVRSPFFLVKELQPLFREGSSIVFVSSVVARIAFPIAPAYAATKAAIDSLTLSFAAELGPKGVRVNALAPGAIETDLAGFLQTEEGRQGTIDMQALKRIGQPGDIADAIAFLASDDSRWITGRTIEASGGSRL